MTFTIALLGDIEPEKLSSLIPQGVEFSHCPSLADARKAGVEMTLSVEQGVWTLRSADQDYRAAVCVDFSRGSVAHRRKNAQSEAVCKAVGVHQKRSLQVCDATAGLGRDSLMLATAGAQVTAVERNPLLAFLLQNAKQAALEQSAGYADLVDVLAKLEFVADDSIRWLEQHRYDVVYLDPMFPGREKSAAVKKEMQLLQKLLDRQGGDPLVEEASLLDVALESCRYRAVVKRPLRAPPLANRTPISSQAGKTVRFDLYVKRSLSALAVD